MDVSDKEDMDLSMVFGRECVSPMASPVFHHPPIAQAQDREPPSTPTDFPTDAFSALSVSPVAHARGNSGVRLGEDDALRVLDALADRVEKSTPNHHPVGGREITPSPLQRTQRSALTNNATAPLSNTHPTILSPDDIVASLKSVLILSTLAVTFSHDIEDGHTRYKGKSCVKMACKHCYLARRFPSGAVRYPTSLESLSRHHGMQGLGKHLLTCELIPEKLRKQLEDVKSTSKKGNEEHIIKEAKRKGYVDGDNCIEFVGNAGAATSNSEDTLSLGNTGHAPSNNEDILLSPTFTVNSSFKNEEILEW